MSICGAKNVEMIDSADGKILIFLTQIIQCVGQCRANAELNGRGAGGCFSHG